MPTVPLPDDPDLAQLRRQARELQRRVRAGDADALAEVTEHHPGDAPGTEQLARFPLSSAQLVLARHYGLASWPRLTRHVAVVHRYSRSPEQVTASADPADEFLRLGCLTYEDDHADRWAAARALLADHPEVAGASIHTAASAADPEAVGRFLVADPGAANAEGGPYRWAPLVYLAYARHDPGLPAGRVLATARRLLAAGGDPDAGYLWHGLPTPFTVLTGVFGEGEQGPRRQPRHPHSLALAQALLDAGAEPNDGQTLYNRQFGPDDDHLALLLRYGLGQGEGGPWRARLGDALDSPDQLVRRQLWWALVHGRRSRLELLAAHGVDVRTPFDDGRTPVELAAVSGHPELVEVLVAHGTGVAQLERLEPADAFVAAALAADRPALDRLRRDHPGLAAEVRRRRPGLVVWAAAQGRDLAVAELVRLGFDVDALGRSDVPVEQAWETALHHAASVGDLRLARLLLSLGADPDRHDTRFDATPLGWARHAEQAALVELLEPVTGADDAADGGSA